MRPAAFLDRDGVLVEDAGPAARARDLRVYACVPGALERLRAAGLARVVVTNQTVVSRGLLDEDGVAALHSGLGLDVDAWYVCPHHPAADVAAYRVACECRKPRPGLLLRAAADLDLDLGRSFMVGDRPSDVEAGRRAGCRTVRVRGEKSDAPPIESPDAFDAEVLADHDCDDLGAAVDWILERVR